MKLIDSCIFKKNLKKKYETISARALIKGNTVNILGKVNRIKSNIVFEKKTILVYVTDENINDNIFG